MSELRMFVRFLLFIPKAMLVKKNVSSSRIHIAVNTSRMGRRRSVEHCTRSAHAPFTRHKSLEQGR